MSNRKKWIFGILFGLLVQGNLVWAQVAKNVEIEVVGQPSWEMLIPMQEKGLIFLIKTDITSLRAFFFDHDLNKIWERELFLDAEEQPKAYTLSDNAISLMFSETSGMYYQVFRFGLDSGQVLQSGFELRDYFMDQDYVFLEDKVIMAGANNKGAAFFTYNFNSDFGKLIEQESIKGKVEVNLFELQPTTKAIESIWAVKTMGYANEKKKKGEFIKEAFVVHAILDTMGQVISKTEIKQSKGNFPMEGRLLRLPSGNKLVMGTYQSNLGDKGIYIYDISGNFEMKTFSFSKILNGDKPMDISDLKALMTSYRFISNEPLVADDRVIFGGAFMRPEYKTFTTSNPNYNYNSNGGYYGSRYSDPFYSGNSRSTTSQVFQGFHYPLGLVLELTETGELLNTHRLDFNNLTFQIEPVMAYNEKGAVSYCLKGDLATNNFNIGNKPILYKLSNEEKTPGNSNAQGLGYLPSYQGVKYWYDNYFIASGGRSKLEASSVVSGSKITEKKTGGIFGKKGKRVPSSFSQVRKFIYLTKIASGI